jgi:hypothetical protein
MEDYALEFVKPFHDNINYHKDQKELIDKAIEISNGDKLTALNYIVTSLLHNDIKDVEFELVFTIPAWKRTTITLPIKECENKDELGYYVSWGNCDITHNISSYTYESDNTKEYIVKFFGMGIYGFGSYNNFLSLGQSNFNKYLTKVISFGKLGHTFTSLAYAFPKCNKNIIIPKYLPNSITNLKYMFSKCKNFNQKLEWDVSNIIDMEGMFSDCINFNQPLDWDVKNVINMSCMFEFCDNFNQILNWNTIRVENMKNMFVGCIKFAHFNQISKWNFENVINVDYMFYKCKNAVNFNQKIKWNIPEKTNTELMFD